MVAQLKHRWHEDGGYKSILKLAVPLILSTGSITIQHFVDRTFLTWYSSEAIAAAMPAALISFTFVSFFIGTASYVNTFVAQYSGAKKNKKIGPVLWQGLYFSLLAGLIVLPLYPLAPKVFEWAGHEPAVRNLEIIYFQIMIFSGFPVTASSACAGFFSGRGKTKTVMWVVIASTTVNIILDYGLIFGNLGLPALGVGGAAIATVISQYVRFLIYLILIFRSANRNTYHTIIGWKLNKSLFARLMKFGIPNGLHLFLEMTGFTLLILIVGKFGLVPLAATNITFNINHLAFMPLVGVGMAVSIEVGRYIGENRPDIAARSTWSAFHMTSFYVLFFAAAYFFIPRLFLFPYAAKADPNQFPAIADFSVQFMKFVAVYCLFDNMNIIFAAAVKGAGDTRFVMWTSVVLSWTVMVIPSYLSTIVLNGNVYTAWRFATLYIFALGNVFFLRFIQGKWKKMRVIEVTTKSVIS